MGGRRRFRIGGYERIVIAATGGKDGDRVATRRRIFRVRDRKLDGGETVERNIGDGLEDAANERLTDGIALYVAGSLWRGRDGRGFGIDDELGDGLRNVWRTR